MRIKIFFGSLLLLLLNSAMLFAQGETPIGGPCGFNDDDNTNCPLDTWVIALALVAIVFAAVHLHKKQKRAALQV